MNKKRILVVDDSFDMLEVLQRQLNALNYVTFQSSNVNDAIDILEHSDVDLLITDLQMPVQNGMELVKYTARHFPNIPMLVITGYPSVAGAVEAVKSGAMEYLVKPFTIKELQTAVEKALAQRVVKFEGDGQKTKKKQDQPVSYWGIIGQSENIKELIDLIRRVKDTKVTTLITGESGTGKELVARAIHYSGKNNKSPFIAVNCGAIPENLLESELFGFVKGAFTGAYESRAGFFQAADGGTIFLDEIGTASGSVQTRLLRVIQEKEITMVGANKPQKIDVRIIAATNSDLYAMSKNGKFREDLYYRLNVISITTPPLRDRRSDVLPLAQHFHQKFSKDFNKEGVTLSKEVAGLLESYAWPGNIRELENVIQRALILCDDEITAAHLPDYIKSASPAQPVEAMTLRTLKEVEYEHILKVLQAAGQNKTEAARILGINRKTLRQKLANQGGAK